MQDFQPSVKGVSTIVFEREGQVLFHGPLDSSEEAKRQFLVQLQVRNKNNCTFFSLMIDSILSCIQTGVRYLYRTQQLRLTIYLSDLETKTALT